MEKRYEVNKGLLEIPDLFKGREDLGKTLYLFYPSQTHLPLNEAGGVLFNWNKKHDDLFQNKTREEAINDPGMPIMVKLAKLNRRLFGNTSYVDFHPNKKQLWLPHRFFDILQMEHCREALKEVLISSTQDPDVAFLKASSPVLLYPNAQARERAIADSRDVGQDYYAIALRTLRKQMKDKITKISTETSDQPVMR